MRGHRIIALILIVTFAASLCYPMSNECIKTCEMNEVHQYQVGEALPYNSTEFEVVRESIFVNQYSPNRAADGYNLVPVQYYHAGTTNPAFGFVLVMNMEGKVFSGLYKEGYGYGHPTWINSTTVALTANDEPDTITIWNIMTNGTEVLPVPSGANDIEYNPNTESFLVIESSNFGNYMHNGTDYTIIGNDIVEYDLEGTELWRWDGNMTFPFNASEYLLREETVEGAPTDIDWMHANSISWDMEDAMIYLTVRNLDCVVKINYASGETEWIIGRYQNEFEIFNLVGESLDNIFYHPDSCEKVGPDQFVCIDTDYWNLTASDPRIGITRFIEFVLDEEGNVTQVVRSLNGPDNSFASSGSMSRIPLENTIIAFNRQDRPVLLEFTQNDRLAWEIEFDSDVYSISIEDIERFYVHPFVRVMGIPEPYVDGADMEINLRVWDNIRRMYETTALITIEEADTVLFTYPFVMESYWQENFIVLGFTGLGIGTHNISVTVSNSEGLEMTDYIIITVEQNALLYANYGAITLIVLITILFIWQFRNRKRINSSPEYSYPPEPELTTM